MEVVGMRSMMTRTRKSRKIRAKQVVSMMNWTGYARAVSSCWKVMVVEVVRCRVVVVEVVRCKPQLVSGAKVRI